MPVDRHILLRYRVLNRCFRNGFREYTIDDLVEECNKALLKEDRSVVSKRTIQSDISHLETDYHICLDEDFYRGRKRLYRYLDTNYTLPMFHMDDTERNKIQDAIRVLNNFEGEPLYDWTRNFLMQIEAGVFDYDSSSYVSFQTNPDLIGQQHFAPLLKAIIGKRVLNIRYTPFGKDTISVKIYPYHLKQYNDRWYLIAQVIGFEGYSNFPLDRIDDYEELALPYKEPEIGFEDYFDDVIGVTVSNGDPIDIVIKVYKDSIGYIKTKPIHLSQRCIEDTPNYVVISINVKPNYELDSKILSFGPSVEILSPDSYRAHIFEKIRSMNKKYMNDEENLHT